MLWLRTHNIIAWEVFPMVPYATLRLRLFPHLRWGFANYSIKENGNRIKIKVTGSGLITYQLTDMLGDSGNEYTYYDYAESDDHPVITEKFGSDFKKLIEDFVLCGSLHDFTDLTFNHLSDMNEVLKEYEECRDVL